MAQRLMMTSDSFQGMFQLMAPEPPCGAGTSKVASEFFSEFWWWSIVYRVPEEEEEEEEEEASAA